MERDSIDRKPVGLDLRGVQNTKKFKWSMPSSESAHNTIKKYLAFLTGVEFEDTAGTEHTKSRLDGAIVL